MENETKRPPLDPAMGDDNADILAAKRRRIAEGRAPGAEASVGEHPRSGSVAPNTEASAAARENGRTVSQDGMQFGTPPRRASAGQSRPASIKAEFSGKSEIKPAVPKTDASPTAEEKPAAPKTADPKPEDDTATRVTDMSAVRTAVPADATRLSAVSADELRRQILEKRQAEEKKRSGSAILSIVKAVMYIVGVVAISVTLAVFIILIGNDVYAFVKDDTVVEVTVPENATLEDISTMLHENGIIEYPAVFEIYSNFNKTKKEKENGFTFIAGTYSVTPMMNYEELLAAFKPQRVTGVSRITIPEGYTTDQIIDLFVSKGIGTREGYVDVINNYDFGYWFIDELTQNGVSEDRYYRLDGYLFPDTYEFYNDSSEKVVIGKLLKRFNQVFQEAYAVKARELGYTVDELLTLASMIEKEAGSQSDFFKISSVFTNRLKKPSDYPYLESDATIVYAIEHDTGEHVNPTAEHMTYESPYNTYKNKGLPPGPIANPSASAIRAALYPADTDFYYFYSASAKETLYAKTYPEHLENIRKASEK